MNSPPTLRVDSFDGSQCDRYRGGHAHRCVPLLSIAEIANRLPEVNISTHPPVVCSEFPVGRSDTMIRRLVSDQNCEVAFGEARA